MTLDLTRQLRTAYYKLRSARRWLIISHISPDADALASAGAVWELARTWGQTVYAYAEGKPADVYDFIPNGDEVRDEPPADLRNFDVILILDCGSISRTGLEARLRTLIKAAAEGRITERPYIIEFDHHQPQESYADLEIRRPEKASTTELIYDFLETNGLEITKNLASCILTGLLTDTGHFLHANSSREAIAIASEMLLRGASLPKIIDHTVNNKSFIALKIWGRVLENMHFNQENGLVFSALTGTELQELWPEGDSDQTGLDLFGDIVSFLSSLAGARAALLLREENGRVRGSLRTNDPDLDVAKIASLWGGGGHRKAAGFTVAGRLSRTETGWKIIKNPA